MKHKPVPIGVVLTGVLYFGLLFYWQWDELSGAGAARDAATLASFWRSHT